MTVLVTDAHDIQNAVRIALPHEWEPRPYQRPVWEHMVRGILRGRESEFTEPGPRAVCVWHRRAGKDRTALHIAAMASQLRPGLYAHVLPTYRQGRKVIWDGKTREGARMLDAFPEVLQPRNPRNDEMTLWLTCASGGESMWQVIGSDRYDALRGGNFVGLVFSEYAWQDPMVWQVTSPILAENGGWAMFISTPNGRNHFHDLLQTARADERWFSEVLTTDDTALPDGQPVIGPEVLAQERKRMSDALFAQEYLCSFNAGAVGAYYAAELARAEADGRVTAVPWEPNLDVWTWWDLGVADATSIWFVQYHFDQVRVIDYLEGTGHGLVHYAKLLKEKPYVYGGHVLPHDARVRELGTGQTRVETAQSLGLRPIQIAPRLPVADGIDAVRTMLPRCWFDEQKTQRGMDALRQYRTERDERTQTFRATPVHDWTSHAADAFRYGAVTQRRQRPRPEGPRPVRMRREYSVLAP